MEKVAIVILNWNGKENTLDCLKSIENIDKEGIDLEIIVVDNASTDDSVSSFKKSFLNIKIIKNPENFGFAKGNNIGIKKALEDKADFVMLLNNDTILEKKCLQKLLEAVKNYPQYSIFAPKIYFEKNFEFHKSRYKNSEKGKVIWYAGGIMDWDNLYGRHLGVDKVDTGQFDKEEETEFATGAAMFVKKEVFEKIGLLDKKYFLYYEDTDFCVRAKKAGFKILFTPKAVLWHKNAGSSASGSSLQDYYITRNRLIFGFKYASLKTKFALLRQAAKFFITGNKTQKKAIYDFLRNYR